MIKPQLARRNMKVSYKKGLTLIEMLVYIVLFSFIMGAGITTSFYLVEEASKVERGILTDAEANFILRKVDRTLNGASSVSSPSAGSNSATLTVSNGGTISIYASGGNILIDSGSGGEVLTSGSITVGGINFFHIAPAGSRPAQINTVLDIGDKEYEKSYVLR